MISQNPLVTIEFKNIFKEAFFNVIQKRLGLYAMNYDACDCRIFGSENFKYQPGNE